MKKVFGLVGFVLAMTVTVSHVDAGCRSRASARRGGTPIVRSGLPRVGHSHPTLTPPRTTRTMPYAN